MTAITIDARPSRGYGLATVLRLSALRTVVELKSFFRTPEAAAFQFALPVVFIFIFGSIFSGTIDGTNVDFTQYFVAGMIATGVFSTTFSNLAVSVSLSRDEGLLKRLGGTPLPRLSYLGGKIGAATAITAIQLAIMIPVGALLFGVDLPQDPERWLRLAWVLALGITAGSSLGFAYTAVIRNAAAATPLVQMPFLVLQFISGVFFVYTDLPGWMRLVGAVFPLKWLAQGLRSVFLPDTFRVAEAAGSWQLPMVALVLAAWAVAGIVVATLTFRWTSRASG